MKTVRTIRSAKDSGKLFGEMMQLVNEVNIVEMIIRYRKKLPIVLRKTRFRKHYAGPNHPKAKKIHSFVLRVQMPNQSTVAIATFPSSKSSKG